MIQYSRCFLAGILLLAALSPSQSHGTDKTIAFGHTNRADIVNLPSESAPLEAALVIGELKKWHKVTLLFDGPMVSEVSSPNPFTDYRLSVTFTNGTETFTVPGYYAADGDAAESSADTGNKWAVHFSPNQTGTWQYTASFRTGVDVALQLSPTAGTSAGFMDGEQGAFTIVASDKSGRDHRATGRLEYVGEHYLQYAETGEYFLKAGADAPENTLAYEDFDDVPNRGNRRKSWAPHAQDYSATDASDYTWQGNNGTELLGVVNYLHTLGMNAFSFLTLSLHGDDENVFPHRLSVPVSTYNGYNDAQQWNEGIFHDRFDVSRMAQWEKIFEYADKKGMFMHFKTMETENDNIMDGNTFGRERMIYYRELIARFGHHLALNWNLSEEITLEADMIESTAAWIKDLDPYDHPVVFHTYPGQLNRYDAHFGVNSSVDGASIQTGDILFSGIRGKLLNMKAASASQGKKWLMAFDEPGTASIGIDSDPNQIDEVRKEVVWNTLTAGGYGVEFYYGYQSGCGDLDCQDHRSREEKYIDAAHALYFFKTFTPFHEMEEMDGLTAATDDYVFAKPDELYVVYRENGGTTAITLPAGNWDLRWYNPEDGTFINTPMPIADQLVAPDNANDWVALITAEGYVFDCIEGDPCDDGDQCTLNDTFDASCNCIGTPSPDSDQDGICDAFDVCPVLDDNLIGTACDDNNDCTTNDVYTDSCECAGELIGGQTISFIEPLDDAYLQGSTLFNNDVLRVEEGNRLSYLKFDLSGVDPSAVIELELTVANDPGNGTITVQLGDQSTWTQDNLSELNKPAAVSSVTQFTGQFSIGTLYSSPVSLTPGGQVSLILEHSNGNDVSFHSQEGTGASPRLRVTTEIAPPAFCNCPADLTGDGIIDIEDFLELNSAFGSSCSGCPADFNDNGLVDINDFIILNSAFGQVCD